MQYFYYFRSEHSKNTRYR